MQANLYVDCYLFASLQSCLQEILFAKSVVFVILFVVGIWELLFVDFHDNVFLFTQNFCEMWPVNAFIEHQLKFVFGAELINYLFTLREIIWGREEWVND